MSRRARAPRPGIEAGEEAAEALSVFMVDFGLRAFQKSFLRDEDEVDRQPFGQGRPAEALPKKPFRPVPRGRGPEASAGRQAEPSVSGRARSSQELKEPGLDPQAARENAPEVGRRTQTRRTGQALGPPHTHATAILSGAKPLPPLLAAALQHETAALGTHADQEAMSPLPFSVVRLVGPLHRGLVPSGCLRRVTGRSCPKVRVYGAHPVLSNRAFLLSYIRFCPHV